MKKTHHQLQVQSGLFKIVFEKQAKVFLIQLIYWLTVRVEAFDQIWLEYQRCFLIQNIFKSFTKFDVTFSLRITNLIFLAEMADCYFSGSLINVHNLQLLLIKLNASDTLK